MNEKRPDSGPRKKLGLTVGSFLLAAITTFGCASDDPQRLAREARFRPPPVVAPVPRESLSRREQKASRPKGWPVGRAYQAVASPYGARRSSGGRSRLHKGVDILAPKNTPVMSTAAGRVVFSGAQRGYGKIVIVEHKDGLATAYAHLNQRRAAVGDRVRRGEIIGLVGSTGNATANHVHYEVRRNGRTLDPRKFLD